MANRKFKTWSRRGEHAQQRTTNSAAGLRPTFCRPRTRQASSHPHSQTRMEPRRYVKKSTLKYRRYILFVSSSFFLLTSRPAIHHLPHPYCTNAFRLKSKVDICFFLSLCVCVCASSVPHHTAHSQQLRFLPRQ